MVVLSSSEFNLLMFSKSCQVNLPAGFSTHPPSIPQFLTSQSLNPSIPKFPNSPIPFIHVLLTIGWQVRMRRIFVDKSLKKLYECSKFSRRCNRAGACRGKRENGLHAGAADIM